jgi:hypothetical protein
VLARLSVLTGQDDLRRLATAALGSQTGVYRAIGVAGAAYASAVMDVSSTSAD